MSSYKTHEMIEDSKITFLQISYIAAAIKPKYINDWLHLTKQSLQHDFDSTDPTDSTYNYLLTCQSCDTTPKLFYLCVCTSFM